MSVIELTLWDQIPDLWKALQFRKLKLLKKVSVEQTDAEW